MKEIKFRGRHVEYHDEIYYGFYEMDARGNHFIIDSNNIMHIVDPESVAQLVGHDSNGKEVYEGDIVLEEYVDGELSEHIARLEPMTQKPETAEFFFFPSPAPFTTLKE